MNNTRMEYFNKNRVYAMRSCLIWYSIILLLLLGLHKFSYKFSNKYLIKAIEHEAFADWALDEKLINGLTFRLAPQNIHLKGVNEKYILVDNKQPEQWWIFKVHSHAREDIFEEATSQFGKLGGLQLFYVHRISLPINGVNVGGTIQPFLKNSKEINETDHLNSDQLKELQKHFIFDYFISNDDFGRRHFLISEEGRMLFGIDKDYLDFFERGFYNDMESLKLGSDVEFYNQFIESNSPEDVLEGLIFADFVSAISATAFGRIFEPLFNELGPEFTGLFHEMSERKNNLFDDVKNFYQRDLEKVYGKSKIEKSFIFKIKRAHFRERLLGAIKKEVTQKKKLLRKIRKKDSVQENIEIVAAPNLRFYIMEKIIDPLLKERPLHISDWDNVCNYLKQVRDDSVSNHAKLAVSIYLLRLNKIFLGEYELLNKYDFYKKIDVVIYPDQLNTESIKNEYLSIINNRNSIINVSEEYHNAMRLIAEIQKNQINIGIKRPG